MPASPPEYVLSALAKLDLPPESSFQEARTAHRELLQVWHPDRYSQNPRLLARATLKAQELNSAWDTVRAWHEQQRKMDADRSAREQAEAQRQARERAEREAVERERVRASAERAQRARAEQERQDQLRREREQAERAQRARAEQERQDQLRREREQAERAQRARTEQERQDQFRREREHADRVRHAEEQVERKGYARRSPTAPSPAQASGPAVAPGAEVMSPEVVGALFVASALALPLGAVVVLVGVYFGFSPEETTASGGAVAGGSWTGPRGYTMMLVPAGSYEVGCTARKTGCEDDEKLAHTVKLSRGTLMGSTEVTQGLWQSVMGSNPSYFSSCGIQCPVEQVSWVDAAQFANALSTQDGLDACYTISGDSVSWPRGLSCTGYRLPTEAEWEVAARGGLDTLYAGGAELAAVGWTRENVNSSTHPVGQKAANGYGLHDMTGNVWEWTWDWYGDYNSGTQVDPEGANAGSGRVRRGGGWYDSAAHARVANRSRVAPASRLNYLGFRLARTMP